MADGAALAVGDGQAPAGPGAGRRGAGQVAGQPRVDGSQAGDLAGPIGQVEQGGQRDGQVGAAGVPGREHPGPRRRRPRRAGRAFGGGTAGGGPGIGVQAAGLFGGRAGLAFRGGGGGAGVGVQEQIQVGAGAQLVHAALQPGLLQLPGPPGNPLVRGQHPVGRELTAGQRGVAGVLGPAFHPGVAGRVLTPLAGLVRGNRMTARAIAARSPPGLSRPARPSTISSAARASPGSRTWVARAMTSTLAWRSSPGPERFPGTGQLHFQGVGQVQHRVRLAADLGQRPPQLIGGELPPGPRHPRRACQRLAGRRAAADQLGHRGVLEGARGRLGPVQGADQPDDLIIGGPPEPPRIAGDPLGEPQQPRPARSHIQALPRTEPARRAAGRPRHPPRRAGLPRAAPPPGPGLARSQLSQQPPPGRILRVGGILGGERASLRPDRGHVHVPRHRRVLRIVVLLIRTQRLVLVQPGILVRSGAGGSRN